MELRLHSLETLKRDSQKEGADPLNLYGLRSPMEKSLHVTDQETHALHERDAMEIDPRPENQQAIEQGEPHLQEAEKLLNEIRTTQHGDQQTQTLREVTQPKRLQTIVATIETLSNEYRTTLNHYTDQLKQLQKLGNDLRALSTQGLQDGQQGTSELRPLIETLQSQKSIYGHRSDQLQQGFKNIDRTAKILIKQQPIIENLGEIIQKLETASSHIREYTENFLSHGTNNDSMQNITTLTKVNLAEYFKYKQDLRDLPQAVDTFRQVKKEPEEQARGKYVEVSRALEIAQNHFYLKNTDITLYIYHGKSREIVSAPNLRAPCAVGVVLTKLNDVGVTTLPTDKGVVNINKDRPYSREFVNAQSLVAQFIGNRDRTGSLSGQNFLKLAENMKRLHSDGEYSLVRPKQADDWKDVIQKADGKGIITGIAVNSEKGELIGHAVLLDKLFDHEGTVYVNSRDPMGISYSMSLDDFMKLHISAAIAPYA